MSVKQEPKNMKKKNLNACFSELIVYIYSLL